MGIENVSMGYQALQYMQCTHYGLALSSFVSYLFLLTAQSVDCFYPGLMDYPCLPPPAQRMARARQLKRIIKKYSNAASMLLRQMGLHFSS